MDANTVSTLQSVVYIILIIFLPLLFIGLIILTVWLIKLVKNATTISKDVESVTKHFNDLSEDEKKFTQFTTDVVSGTANNVLDHQTQRITKNIIATIINSVRKNR